MGSVCNRPEYNPGRAASLSLADQFLTAIPNPVRPVLTCPAPTGYAFALAFLSAVEQLTGAAAMRLDTVFRLVLDVPTSVALVARMVVSIMVP